MLTYSAGSSFVEPQQRRTFSQASTSTQSAGSSFATSSISPTLPPQPTAGPSRLSDLRVNRITEPTPSLSSDVGDFADEERPPCTPPSVRLQPAFRKRTEESPRSHEEVDGDFDSMDETTGRAISRHSAANASNATLVGRASTSRASAFPNRPTTSELLPTLSPNKPRPKGRISTKAQKDGASERHQEDKVVYTVSSDEEDDPLSIITPSQPLRASTSAAHHSRHSSQQALKQVDIDHRGHSRSRSRARTPAANANLPHDASAGSLEAEIKKMLRAEVEREFEAEIQELNAESERYLTGRGKRPSQSSGFMKGGGGAGEPVWMGNGNDHGVGSGGHLRDADRRERAKARSTHPTRE